MHRQAVQVNAVTACTGQYGNRTDMYRSVVIVETGRGQGGNSSRD